MKVFTWHILTLEVLNIEINSSILGFTLFLFLVLKLIWIRNETFVNLFEKKNYTKDIIFDNLNYRDLMAYNLS